MQLLDSRGYTLCDSNCLVMNVYCDSKDKKAARQYSVCYVPVTLEDKTTYNHLRQAAIDNRRNGLPQVMGSLW